MKRSWNACTISAVTVGSKRLGVRELEELGMGLPSAARGRSVLHVVVVVVAQVAALAHRLQVLRPAVHRRVIQVRYCQDDLALRPLRRLAVTLYAAPWA